MEDRLSPGLSPPLRQQPWRPYESQRRGRAGTSPLLSPSPQGSPQTPSIAAFAPSNPPSPDFSTTHAAAVNFAVPGSRPPLRAFESFDSERTNPYASHSRAGSNTALLTPESSFTFTEGEGPPVPDPYDQEYRPREYIVLNAEPKLLRWSRRFNAWWQPSWTMLIFLSLGVVGALSHHAFYARLHGTEATDQLRMTRYGAVLSFLTKACLAAAVLLAYRQRVWATVRTKLFSVTGIDMLFAASEDVTALFSFEIFRQAKLAMCLALFIWITPLVVILTSDTLTVNLATVTDNTTCPSVRTLNFSHEQEDKGYFRDPLKIRGLFELSTSFWNTTSANISDPGWFDYWDAPSTPLIQLSQMTAYYQKPLERDGAAAEVCGVGWNCSFVVNFTAPGYRCQELANGIGAKTRPLGDALSPVHTNMLIPEGDLSYVAAAMRGDYVRPQMDFLGSAGVPAWDPPYPSHFGVFRTEPVIWIGYSIPVDPSQPLPANKTDPAWPHAFVPKVFACENYRTAYRVRFNYYSSGGSGGGQSVDVLSRTYLSPIMTTTFLPDVNATDGTLDNTTATPASGYVSPGGSGKDIARYRLTAAYHSIGSVVRAFLDGYLNASSPNEPITATQASQTKLVDQMTYLPVPDLMAAVQSLCDDVVLSLFSNPRFLVVSWAANPANLSGTAVGGDETRYSCVRERRVNTFYYHQGDLWAVYGVAIVLACVGVGLGWLALNENGGVMRGVRFSDIVGATRGPGLDRLAAVAGDGDSSAKAVRLGYGLVPKAGTAGGGGGFPRGGGYGYGWARDEVLQGFGIEGEVRQDQEKRRSMILGRLGRKDSPI